MRKRITLLVALVALTAAACSAAGTPLAVVNDSEVTPEELAEFDPTYEEVEPQEEAAFRQDLRFAVVLRAIETSAEAEFGIVVTDEEVDAVFTDPQDDLAAAVANWEALLAAGDITEGQARADARSLLIRRQVAAALVDESPALDETWEATPQAFVSACVRHILTATEEEAQAAYERVAAGEDFAAVAAEVSVDTSTASNGGLLSDPESGECELPLSLFIPEFGYEAALAPVGAVAGPFETQFGFHVIVVEERTGPTSLEELKADPETYLNDELAATIANPWLGEAIATAVIVVDPAIGMWSVAEGDIVPIGGDGDVATDG